MLRKTCWYDFVSNDDLNVTESYNSMIMYCWVNRVFAYQKACGCRTIFPSNSLYHPTDGNALILIDDSDKCRERKFLQLIDKDINFSFERITTIKQLEKAIKHYNMI